MIQINNHSFFYHNEVGIKNITCEFELGRGYALIGPNGAGKTTLFHSLIGVHQTNSTINIDGENDRFEFLKHVSICDVIEQVGTSVASHLHFTVLKYIKSFKNLSPDFDAEYAAKYIDYFEIDLFSNLNELSKGQSLLLYLICSLSRDVNFYLLDEPFASIDQIYRKEVLNMILDKISDGKTVIVSSHDLHTLNSSFDNYYFLKEGKLIKQISIDDMVNYDIFDEYKSLYKVGDDK